MINEERTFSDFNYNSKDLSHGSHKKVWRICKICSVEKLVCYKDYIKNSGLCSKCAKSGKNHPMYGKCHTEESKQKIAKKNSGENHPFYGRHHTKESKQKQSSTLKGRFSGINSPNWKGGAKLRYARENSRRKQFGFVPHNNPHIGFHGHHVDINNVIYIPQELHVSIYHSVTRDINMDKINDIACEWFLLSQGIYI